MDIRPQDLPELRAEAIRHQVQTQDVVCRLWEQSDEVESNTARAYQNLHLAALERAPLFWVSPAMGELAWGASETLASFVVNEDDLPAPSGLLVFAQSLPTPEQWPNGQVAFVRALAWIALGAYGVSVVPYYDRDEAPRIGPGMPKLICSPVGSFGFPYQSGEWASGSGPRRTLLPTLLSAWLLMQQPLAKCSEVEPDRAARRRLRRVDQEPKPVRVIELRRPKASSSHGDSDREYHHRWITRGHWRQQWYPAREVHRPVWIAPHIKGPEGAPLIGGEKVYAWKR